MSQLLEFYGIGEGRHTQFEDALEADLEVGYYGPIVLVHDGDRIPLDRFHRSGPSGDVVEAMITNGRAHLIEAPDQAPARGIVDVDRAPAEQEGDIDAEN